jgi:hypothetical protein
MASTSALLRFPAALPPPQAASVVLLFYEAYVGGQCYDRYAEPKLSVVATLSGVPPAHPMRHIHTEVFLLCFACASPSPMHRLSNRTTYIASNVRCTIWIDCASL